MKPLRKRHLQIWTTLAVLLPGGIVLAWLAIPNSTPVKLLQSPSTELLPVIMQSIEKKNYCINLRSNKDNTQWQMEWKNKSELNVPSAVIYKAPLNRSEGGALEAFKINDAELIGRIEAVGSYVFPLENVNLENMPLQFVLYDFIHQQIIDTINFKISSSTGGGQEEAL